MDDSFFAVNRKGKDEDTSIPEFHKHPCFVGKDKKTGIEKYEDTDYVKILNPGQRDIVDRAVTDDDKARWPDSWAAYQAGQTAPLNGFPIENWGVIGPTDVRMLKSFHVRSVEDLAGMPDGNLARVGPGGIELKKKAVRWLREHESTESLLDRIERLESGNVHSIPSPDEESDQIKALKIEIRELKNQLKGKSKGKAKNEAA